MENVICEKVNQCLQYVSDNIDYFIEMSITLMQLNLLDKEKEALKQTLQTTKLVELEKNKVGLLYCLHDGIDKILFQVVIPNIWCILSHKLSVSRVVLDFLRHISVEEFLYVRNILYHLFRYLYAEVEPSTLSLVSLSAEQLTAKQLKWIWHCVPNLFYYLENKNVHFEVIDIS